MFLIKFIKFYIYTAQSKKRERESMNVKEKIYIFCFYTKLVVAIFSFIKNWQKNMSELNLL